MQTLSFSSLNELTDFELMNVSAGGYWTGFVAATLGGAALGAIPGGLAGSIPGAVVGAVIGGVVGAVAYSYLN